MDKFINFKKIELAIENGTDEEKEKIFKQINQLNATAESVWIRTQLRKRTMPSQAQVIDGANLKQSDDNEKSGTAHLQIKLMEIGGGRNGNKNYYDESGHVYTKKQSSNNCFYFRCKHNISENCNAKGVCKGENLDACVLSRPHSHDPKQSSLHKSMFSKKIEEICTTSPFKKSQEIYNDAKKSLRSQIDMSNIPERRRFDSFIHRKLKKNIPLLAKSIEEFEQLINDPQYSSSYIYDEQKKIFYHGVWRGSTGANIVFLSDTVLQEVLSRKKEGVTLLMDGTFKSLPLHIKFRQLYIISVIIEERSYPLAYILMTRRDTKSYELILSKLRSMFPSVNVECCMSDYEAATRKAIRSVFPAARLAGCYFHYVQAIVKAFKRFGLKQDEKFKLARQQVSALALLPNEFVTQGFNIVSKAFKKSIRWGRFADYWMRQWSEANISVYGLKDRTNNFAESLNKTINSILKAPHPHIWLLIENLRMVEMNRSDELIRVSRGHMMKSKNTFSASVAREDENGEEIKEVKKAKKESKSEKMKKLNEKIRNATALFNESQNVKRFLKNVTFDESLESYFKERISIDSDDSGIEEEFDEDFDETVIPNNLNVESNFRKHFPRTVCKRPMKCDEKIATKKRKIL